MCLMCCRGLQTVSVVSTKYCYVHVFFSGACCNGLCLVSVDIVTCMFFLFQEHAVMVCVL